MDALKSSTSYQQLPWMRLYKEVSLLDSVSCHKLSDPDGELVFPSPRASHSLNFVSDCLVLFGGGCEGGQSIFCLIGSSDSYIYSMFWMLVYFVLSFVVLIIKCVDMCIWSLNV